MVDFLLQILHQIALRKERCHDQLPHTHRMKCCTHLSGALSSNTRSPAKKRSLVQLVGRRSSNTQNPIAWKQVRQLDCSRSTFKRQHPAWRSTVKHDGSREKEESSSWKLEETHGGCWKRRRRRADSWLGMDSS
ncbi:hypothetical protein VIGAN_09106700 [Vigna angularis var. angularis]|uniref:Uncharacterized protein n=1 Tax=Vigna angularis var. angularis TaxID=157739 RepID=A0A0S3SXQ9_PHAAN|nr:hypothetical protein VIGAN_09106700 [Vigna angularis var. angularis]